METNSFSIAIDGPVGVGKGTLAVALSKKLGAIYVNTGAMYRALTLECLDKNTEISSEEKVLELLKKSLIELKINNSSTHVFLNGKEISREIFLPKVSNTVASISIFPSVRKEMVKRQKEMIKGHKRIVIEGRDITTDVLPNADLKIFLTADISVRSQRRYNQMIKNKIDISPEEVLVETEKRDKLDMEREASPLVIAKDAYVLDTTNLTVDQTVDLVMEKLKEKGIL